MSAPFKVYIVFGQTGEYSNHSDWPVRGFLVRELAERFEFGCAKWAYEHSERIDEHEECDDCYSEKSNGRKCPDTEKSPHDPKYRRDYTGTDYFVVEVEVEP